LTVGFEESNHPVRREIVLVYTLNQGCPTGGPGAGSGPPAIFEKVGHPCTKH